MSLILWEHESSLFQLKDQLTLCLKTTMYSLLQTLKCTQKLQDWAMAFEPKMNYELTNMEYQATAFGQQQWSLY